jgi:ABC-2 type transport system permease protein
VNLRVLRALISVHIRKVLADRGNLFWLFGMPMMFSILMGMMFGAFDGSSGLPEVRVYDADRSDASRDLVSGLEGSDHFVVVVADTVGSVDLARDLVNDGRRTATLYIPPGMADSLSTGGTAHLSFFHDADRLSAQSARTDLEMVVARLEAEGAGRRLAAGDFDAARFDSLWNEPRLTLDSTFLGRREQAELKLSKGGQHTGPAYTLMFVMMFMLMSVRDVVVERRNGTLTRLRLGAASPSLLAVGMLAGPWVVGLLQMTILLLLNAVVMGIDYGESVASLVVLMVLFTGVSTSLALVLATFCRTPGQADGIGMTASMTLAPLGGLWWPLEVVPGFMQKIGLALPTGQGITIFHDMIGRGYGLIENSGQFLALGVWLVVLLAIATVRFRRLID